MVARGFAVLVVVACCLLPHAARASFHDPHDVVVAQAATTNPKPNVTGNLPSATWVLVVLGVVLAGYVSYRFGTHRGPASPKRREGPISRALSHGHREHEDR